MKKTAKNPIPLPSSLIKKMLNEAMYAYREGVLAFARKAKDNMDGAFDEFRIFASSVFDVDVPVTAPMKGRTFPFKRFRFQLEPVLSSESMSCSPGAGFNKEGIINHYGERIPELILRMAIPKQFIGALQIYDSGVEFEKITKLIFKNAETQFREHISHELTHLYDCLLSGENFAGDMSKYNPYDNQSYFENKAEVKAYGRNLYDAGYQYAEDTINEVKKQLKKHKLKPTPEVISDYISTYRNKLIQIVFKQLKSGQSWGVILQHVKNPKILRRYEDLLIKGVEDRLDKYQGMAKTKRASAAGIFKHAVNPVPIPKSGLLAEKLAHKIMQLITERSVFPDLSSFSFVSSLSFQNEITGKHQSIYFYASFDERPENIRGTIIVSRGQMRTGDEENNQMTGGTMSIFLDPQTFERYWKEIKASDFRQTGALTQSIREKIIEDISETIEHELAHAVDFGVRMPKHRDISVRRRLTNPDGSDLTEEESRKDFTTKYHSLPAEIKAFGRNIYNAAYKSGLAAGKANPNMPLNEAAMSAWKEFKNGTMDHNVNDFNLHEYFSDKSPQARKKYTGLFYTGFERGFEESKNIHGSGDWPNK